MLKLWADFSDKLNSVYSIFVIFQYNEYYVNIMKSMKNRAYDKQKKIWEIGWDCYSQLIGTLNQYGIPYNGPEFMESICQMKFLVILIKIYSSVIQVKLKKLILNSAIKNDHPHENCKKSLVISL